MSIDTPSVPKDTYPAEKVDFRKIWWVGLLAVLASVVANLLVRAVGLALIDAPADFVPLQGPGAVILFTSVQVLAAVIVFAIVARFARRPYRTFTLIAWVALFLSFIPDILLLLNPGAMPMGTPTPGAAALLMSMHVVAFAITLFMLTRLTRAAV
jgi:hypothetical protein